MPARYVVVHDEHEFTSALMRKLGSDLAWFDDPAKALAALEAARTVQFLITRLAFSDRQPVVALRNIRQAISQIDNQPFQGSAVTEICRGLENFLERLHVFGQSAVFVVALKLVRHRPATPVVEGGQIF
jgi:hypothetical protein